MGKINFTNPLRTVENDTQINNPVIKSFEWDYLRKDYKCISLKCFTLVQPEALVW